MLIALLCAHLLAAPADSAVLLIRVLDVSDARIGGDAILITDSAGGRARHVLIDASDHGATVVRLLRRFHVDTLAALILSHPHADHYGGMNEVVAQFPVRSFVYGGTRRTARTYVALLDQIAARHIPVITVDSSLRRITLVTGHDTVLFTVFSPPSGCRTLHSGANGADVNNCSIGVRLTRGTFAMLLPGDAEQAELGWWLMVDPALLHADVLKAGHHGSSNATTAPLLDAVAPRLVLISANGRQHPFAEVLDLLNARGIRTYCTADDGTITVRVVQHRDWTVAAERTAACHPRTEHTTGGPP
jgi:beta-lactamase superfamily II metal-dependent hydrolase